MRRVLVTGAAGFAGGYLVRELRTRGFAVCGTYHRTLPPGNAGDEDVRWFDCDIRDPAAVRDVVRTSGPDGIIHLAAMSIPTHANSNPIDTYATNVGGWVNLLEATRAVNPRCKLVLISSCHVYGGQVPGPEGLVEDLPLKPRDVYGASRAAAESLADIYGGRGGLGIVVARSFNHCGPGQNPNYFIATLTQQVARIALGQCAPTLHLGNLQVIRDFTDVRDVVRAYAELLSRGRPGLAYNVCLGRPTALSEVVETLSRVAGCELDVTTDGTRVRAGESAIIVGSPRRLWSATAWAPRIALEDTLRDMLNYWKGQLAAPLLQAVG